MTVLNLLPLTVLPALVIVAALKDLTTMTIPNWISIALSATFLPVAVIAGLAPMELLSHLGVGLAALAVGIGLFALRLIGGGDAKLMAASCLWLGPDAVLAFTLTTAIAGGVLSLGLLSARKQLQLAVPFGPSWFGRLMEPKGDIPYGLAIAAGVLIAFPSAELFRIATGV